MALPICAEAFIRTFWVIIKLALENWFWTIGVVVLAVGLKRSPAGVGVFGWILNTIQDLVKWFGGVAAGGFGVVGGYLIMRTPAVMLGILWGVVVLISPANLILRILTAPIALVFGTIWGFLPVPFLPLSWLYAKVFSDRGWANIACIVMLALVFILVMLDIDFCP
jgi:hypothetical protein